MAVFNCGIACYKDIGRLIIRTAILLGNAYEISNLLTYLRCQNYQYPMRALLIDAHHQEIKEIVLTGEAAMSYQEIKQLLNSERIDTIHPNNQLTILFDPLAFAQPGTPGFLLEMMKEFPLFGNAICVGRNLGNYQMEDLPNEFTGEKFEVSWFDLEEEKEIRKKAMQIGIDNYRS
jgi:hypothetical protein